MKHRLCCLSTTLALGLGLVLVLLWLSCTFPPPVLAQSGTGIIRVSNIHPNSLDTPGCGSQSIPCLTVQYAVDQALPGEEIRVAAGIYTDVNNYGGQRQVVAISKTLTLRGGYTTTSLAGTHAPNDWLPPDPDANPSILDAEGQGRVLHISGDITVTIEGLHLTGGDNTPEFYPLAGSPGGGAYVLSATATFSHCDVYDNTSNKQAYGSGGGIYADSATLTVNRCDIHDNAAGNAGPSYSQSRGGGLCLMRGSAILIDNRIHHNYGSYSVAGYGGGLYAWDVTPLTLTNNIILSNTAVLTAKVGGFGGGAYLSASPATLLGNTIRDNHACKTHYPGFLYIDCLGGGIAFSHCESCSLSANRIESNTASGASDGQGGGLWFQNGDAELLRNNLLHNSATLSTTAEGLGGALYASGLVTLTMINNMVTANQANSQGSGLWFGGNGSQAQGWLLHNTIADNGGPGSGAPGSTAGSILAASGGQGIYAAPAATLALSNTILSGHPGAALFVSATSTAVLEASLWFENGADTAGPGAISTGTINIAGDPDYINPGGDDYHLAGNSAAIDAGIDAGVSDDFDSQSRPAGAGYDLGADEVLAGPHSAYLPQVLKNMWQNPPPRDYDFSDVWGSSSSDVFAVGNDGTILHYDGTSWTAMSSGTFVSLQGVWGSSGSNVFAVGYDGTILHYDGTDWNAMSSGTTEHFGGVWGSSGGDVFAVGSAGTILHYDGTDWNAMSSGATKSLSGVWGSSGSDVFAVGNAGILHYDGASWSPMSSRGPSSVWGSSGSDVFAVGYNHSILHYDGTGWTAMTRGLQIGFEPWFFGVWGSSGNDVFAVSSTGWIWHYDGTSWTAMSSGTSEYLMGIWGSSGSTVFAVGGGGTILHYDGTAWSPMDSGTTENLTSVWGSADTR